MGEVGGAKESLKKAENNDCEGMDQSRDEQSTKQKRKSMVRTDGAKRKHSTKTMQQQKQKHMHLNCMKMLCRCCNCSPWWSEALCQ